MSETQAKYSPILQINCSTNEENKKGHMLLHEKGHVLLHDNHMAEGIPRLFKRRAFVSTSWINICMCCLLQPWSNQHLFCNSVCHQFRVLPTNLPFYTRVQNSLWQAFRKSLPRNQTSQSRGEQQQEIAPPIFKVREMHVTGRSRGRQKNPL